MQRAALGRVTVRSGEVDCNSERDLNTTSKVVNKCWNLNQLKVSELKRSTTFYNAVTSSINQLICRCNDMTNLFWSTHQSKFDAKCWITVWEFAQPHLLWLPNWIICGEDLLADKARGEMSWITTTNFSLNLVPDRNRFSAHSQATTAFVSKLLAWDLKQNWVLRFNLSFSPDHDLATLASLLFVLKICNQGLILCAHNISHGRLAIANLLMCGHIDIKDEKAKFLKLFERVIQCKWLFKVRIEGIFDLLSLANLVPALLSIVPDEDLDNRVTLGESIEILELSTRDEDLNIHVKFGRHRNLLGLLKRLRLYHFWRFQKKNKIIF